ncbi:serologically defined colon cancer antigen 8 isoform X1 [Canis lupus familiaris]|uniref:SHH signaling and ciliosis regulator SDCCAG8 n=1 Tax=Canis lupus familiaris TaxID=9615 RepID=A0A8C0P692_CANLF|nr:serologically defined colon cancer antigen 8 isoform X1 [Canis lupus familiaris]XP_038527467.1 serologically defined colon cancer antigen 8 isoform X1 [Canis lupus familiaris]XP_547495.3 serologically defined colon cancer antigen 8 isoform X1 [Canis lupus familiaris]|eukprot:XP_547495.3 serologically defined colon cancer antigen 8 isoform X1 [Canis lupus familiaris]
MAKSPENSTLEEILGKYQRSLRERQNRSIHQLKYILKEGDVTVGEDALDPAFSTSVGDEDPGTAWYELQHSHAVNQLKALLHQQKSKESEVSPSRKHDVSALKSSECEEANMPTVYNLVPIINDQSQYIHHLEAEVKFYKDELSGMKNRIQVAELENEKLQEELKSQRQKEAMREQTLLDVSGNLKNSWITTGEDSGMDEAAKKRFSHGNVDTVKGPSASETEKWKLELERLNLTYEEKTGILESQLKFLRKDLAEYQKNCEDLKEQLKHKESLLATNISNRVGGLCLKCAQHEAVLSQTHNNVHVQTIERLTKERDDLMSALVSVRSSLTDVQQREANAYEQVKQAVQMTEEANFEKTKALIQCEQLKNELERQTERLEKELTAQQEKRASEKEMMRKEITKEREDMGSKMLSLSQNIAQLEAQVEKITREKISAINQLEGIQNHLASKEMEATKVCGEMRYQLNKTKMEKDEAEKEHREYRTKTKRDLEIKDEEIEKLRLEVSESKQHLEQEQQKAARAREESLKLTELLSESEHQLHLTRLEKDSIQQSFSNEAKAQALQAQQREQELTQKIQQMETQHDKTENEQYSLLTSQNTFLTKLKEECCALAKKLEQISQKSRSEIAQLSQEKKYTYDKLEKLQRRNDELEEQCVQHGRLHEIMKQRLKQLDKHSQATAQQLVQLLNKQNQLLLERQSLSEEVGRLRSQLPSMRQSDC